MHSFAVAFGKATALGRLFPLWLINHPENSADPALESTGISAICPYLTPLKTENSSDLT